MTLKIVKKAPYEPETLTSYFTFCEGGLIKYIKNRFCNLEKNILLRRSCNNNNNSQIKPIKTKDYSNLLDRTTTYWKHKRTSMPNSVEGWLDWLNN